MTKSRNGRQGQEVRSRTSVPDLNARSIVRLLEKKTKDRRPLIRHLRDRAPVAELTRALTQAKVPRTRQLISDVLGYKRAKSAVPVLAQLLGDEHPKVRFAAADAIGKIFLLNPSQRQNGRRDAGEALYRALESETEPGLREVFITALGAVRYEPALPALRAALDSPDEPLQKAARWALERFEPDDASPEHVSTQKTDGSKRQRNASAVQRPANFIDEAIRTLQANPEFVADVIRAGQEPHITLRLMQDTIQSLHTTPNVYEDAVRAARETPIFVEATIRAMEATPSFVQEAVRAAQDTPSTLPVVEEMVEAVGVNPAFVEEAIRAAQRAPDALQATEKAIRRASSPLVLQESIRMMAQVQDKVAHGDALMEGLAQLSQSLSEAGARVGSRAELRVRERKATALQAVLAFLILYLILTLAARSWQRQLGISVSDLEVFLATLLVWQQSRVRPKGA
jgi:hypothetical protein